MKVSGEKEERLMLLESWQEFEVRIESCGIYDNLNTVNSEIIAFFYYCDLETSLVKARSIIAIVCK